MKKAGATFIFPKSEIKGFRAPLLGHNDAMFKALENFKFLYETNKIFGQNRFPERGNSGNDGTILNFPLYGVYVAGRNTIAMDYNLYVIQTGGKSVLEFKTPEWEKAYTEVLDGYLHYFYNHYNYKSKSKGNSNDGFRVPVTIGHHFSLWNDGLYWSVMKDFARQVCGKEKVVCGTGREYEAFLKSWGK